MFRSAEGKDTKTQLTARDRAQSCLAATQTTVSVVIPADLNEETTFLAVDQSNSRCLVTALPHLEVSRLGKISRYRS